MVRDSSIRPDDILTGSAETGASGWLARRRLRYKTHRTLQLTDVRANLRTGDIILFHKTARSGILDTFELDFLAPLFFRTNEFRHCGIVLRRGDDVSVVECTQPQHTGREHAAYPTGGPAIREVPLEPLLESYTRDNGVPHFAVRHVPVEISGDELMRIVTAIGPVVYLEGTRSIPLYAASLLMPSSIVARMIARYSNEMMCSEFVHRVLAECGVLRAAPSKIFPPYIIEGSSSFAEYDLVGYSDLIRFTL
ncbi:MAG TPA: hypothetical protein VJL35_12525 [Gemmatimonadaceae bacterium]|nr:hypothetical protein [Gemmatimonadaceae bacterium]